MDDSFRHRSREARCSWVNFPFVELRLAASCLVVAGCHSSSSSFAKPLAAAGIDGLNCWVLKSRSAAQVVQLGVPAA